MKNLKQIRTGVLALSLLIGSASVTLADAKTDKNFNRIDKDGSATVSVEELAGHMATMLSNGQNKGPAKVKGQGKAKAKKKN